MSRIRKSFGVFSVLVSVALISLALVLSYNSPCGPVPEPHDGAKPMKAVVYSCYGAPDVLQLAYIEKPTVADDQVLVKVHAAAVNPLDWHYMRGTPYFMRIGAGLGAPEIQQLGVDFAGTVEAVGRSVKRFRPGDEVFGGRTGAFAEYVTIREEGAMALKPTNMSFQQAASVPIAAITALQALRDKGRIHPGQRVLINGASGGVGTFAVQIAKSFGAEVTGVCSTRNVDMVRSLGADYVIDYTQENFTQGEKHYDLIVDMVGSHSLLEYRRVLKPRGIFVIVGGPDGKWLGPLASPIKAKFLSPFVEQEFGMILAELNKEDLAILADLMQTGKLKPVIDKTYALRDVADAVRYLEEGHARGKVVISMASDDQHSRAGALVSANSQ